MNSALLDILNEAGRLLFLGLLPIIAIVCLGSVLSTVIQASLAVQDQTFGFGIRFLSFLLGLYLFLPAVISSLLELTQLAYGT
jgi:type III secretory pathway component EscS